MIQPSTVASAGATSPGQPFGFTDVARLLQERGRIVRNVMAGFVGLTILVLLLWPSRYSATAVVMLDPRKNTVTDRSQVLTELPGDPASVQNQIQILTSHDLAATVIERLGLADDPDFNGALASFPMNLLARGLSPQAQRTQIVDTFLKQLTAEAEGLSTSISVRFSAKDPDKAARIANTIVDSYIDAQVQQKSVAGRRTTAWLGARIAELGRQVQAADDEVQAYKAANELNDGGQGTASLVDQQLAAINTQLVQARADLAEKMAANDHVAALVKSGHAAYVSQVVSSPLIVQLREQQADALRNQADVDSRYGPRHPKRLAVESQLRDLDDKVELEAERIAGSVANDVAVARAQVQSLEASLAGARGESNTQNFARVKLKALEASAASTRTMYESFVTRLREAQDQDPVTMPDARIISHASVPARPSWPPRLIGIGASIPAGFLLGLLCALAMERMGYEPPRSWNAGSVPRRAVVPVIGRVPDALVPFAADQVAGIRLSPFAEGILVIARWLAWSTAANTPKAILVSGIDQPEARTNIAVGLARALALLGRNVVLLDADFGARSASRTMGADCAPAGLLEALRGTAPLSRALAADRRSSALVLSSAAPPRNPQALWSGPEIKGLLQQLRRTCDFVVIDSPPDREMSLIARLVDGVMLVGPKDALAALQAAADALAASGAQVAGVVLTR